MKRDEQVVVLVSHADDESVGCGGYIPLLKRKGFEVIVVIASNCRFDRKGKAINNKDSSFEACRELGVDKVFFLDLNDQEFETYPTQEIIRRLTALDLKPGLIITHSAGDLNRDHRIIHEIAMLFGRSIYRQICILGCEILNGNEYFGGAFHPNFYVDIGESIEIKKRAFSCYQNEARDFPNPYSPNGLEIKARQRGLEVGFQYAEAYQVLRWFPGTGDGF
ncbi:MAG: hypothetical protein HF978_00085 [Desulfobacteraceae bacterium]|nr:PIG-L family deacetylase [Desulfobacteraceae bacterium]MBC2753933.1 hypothetical protein [Desulfobacteraceae bacterium]